MFRVDAYGRLLGLEQRGNGWAVYYLGGDGKRRRASDFNIPGNIETVDAAVQHIADLLHEYATERHPHVRRL